MIVAFQPRYALADDAGRGKRNRLEEQQYA